MKFLLQHRPALIATIVLLLAFDTASLWQRLGGAYASGFGGHSDEASHFVTGLMARDYIAAGFPGSPVKYAKDYATHYPEISLGKRPPLFYIAQSLWTFPFGTSRASVLLLIAVFASLTALLIFVVLRRDFGGWNAALGAFLWISIPLVREYYGMVMVETLDALLMFGATLAFGQFMDREKPREIVVFGILTGLAIMTNGNALALGLMAVLSLLFSRKWHLLGQPALWAGIGITALLAGPWTWSFRGAATESWLQPIPSVGFALGAFRYYVSGLSAALGPLLSALLLVGLCTVWRQKIGGSFGTWIAAGALLLAVLLFQSLVPLTLEPRHLISAIPPALLFVVAGFRELVPWLVSRSARSEEPIKRIRVAYAGAALLIVISILPGQAKSFGGFAAIAKEIVEVANVEERVLVSSDAKGEGMFIAEVAMRDPNRPSFTIQRASATLANSESGDQPAHSRYRSDQELYQILREGRARYIVLDNSVPDIPRLDHHNELKRAVGRNSDIFRPVAESKIRREGTAEATSLRMFRIERRLQEN